MAIIRSARLLRRASRAVSVCSRTCVYHRHQGMERAVDPLLVAGADMYKHAACILVVLGFKMQYSMFRVPACQRNLSLRAYFIRAFLAETEPSHVSAERPATRIASTFRSSAEPQRQNAGYKAADRSIRTTFVSLFDSFKSVARFKYFVHGLTCVCRPTDQPASITSAGVIASL